LIQRLLVIGAGPSSRLATIDMGRKG